MSVGRTSSIALLGLTGVRVDIEADVARGLPKFAVVGLPDRSLSESTDRVRSAIVNCGLDMPAQRVTVNLSPAALPKAGSGFDLGIALASLAATRQVPGSSVENVVHIGELALDGRLRPTPGVLPAVAAAARAGVSTVMVPEANLAEAKLVSDITAVGVASLRQAAIWHGASLEGHDVVPLYPEPLGRVRAENATAGDLADVIGHAEAREALIAAAAGGHHMFMLGPPGSGKTMLASRLAGLLPDLSPEQALEVACVRSLGDAGSGQSLPIRPPLESPHHTATTTALVGGGSGLIRPGSVARAHHGVLFLDEAPEFSRTTLDALRQPLESGEISIHRAMLSASFPARFLLVMAANPCPCGKFGVRGEECTCPPSARTRYLARLSGPLRDRIDINLNVDRVSRLAAQVSDESVSTLVARQRVERARARAAARWNDPAFWVNSQVPGSLLRSPAFRLPAESTRPLDRGLERGQITMRGYDRTLRLAWTLSDLDEQARSGSQGDRPSLDHVGRALMLRRGIK